MVEFLESHQKIVVKPTDKMGGQSVFVIERGDANTNVILEEVTNFQNRFIQVQSYIPEISQEGDKRILLIDELNRKMIASGDYGFRDNFCRMSFKSNYRNFLHISLILNLN